MNRARIAIFRWLATACMLAGALLLYSRTASAANYYWVYFYNDISCGTCGSGCTPYNTAGGTTYELFGIGYGNSGNCYAISNATGSSEYSYCGTSQPTAVYGGVGYFSAPGVFYPGTNSSTSWGTCTSTYKVSPITNSSGTSCGSTSYFETSACGETNP